MKAAHAASLRSKGYTLIPLRGKIPIPTGWEKAGPLDYPNAGNNGGNYGVALKAGDLVIDVDPRHFEEGDKPLARLVEAVGVPLSSFAVKTGGGGLHIYFTKPPDIKVAHTLKEYPGLEFKSSGRQVVGPGSVHPDTGKEYTIAVDGEVRPAPEALLSLLKVTAVPYSEIEKGGNKNADYKNDSNTQGRFVEYLKTAEISVEGKQGDATAFKTACHGRDLGLPPANTLELMVAHWNGRCEPPWEEDELEAKVIHAYKYAKGGIGDKHPAKDFQNVAPAEDKKEDTTKEEEIAWQLTRSGQVVKCFYNLLNYLRLPSGGLKGVFGFNEFTGQVEFIAPAPWHKGAMPKSPLVQDKDLKLLKGYLAVKHGFEMNIGNIEEAITVVSHTHRFHPVRRYLSGLKWDGKPRIDQWLQTYAGAIDNNYVRAIGRKTLVAAVMRVLHPGCKFDHVLTLEGPQDAGKSMLCAALGGEWSADFSVDPQAVDTVAAMQGKWFIELAELSVLRRTERNALKAFITRTTDKVRVAYGRLHQEYPRQSIFLGSINPEADNAYLEDPSGNRRWWPVEVGGRIDFKGVRRDRDQLFAEAVVVAKEGKENLFMDSDELKGEANAVVAARHAEDPWTERISAWLFDPLPKSANGLPAKKRDFVTSRDIFIEAMGGIDKQLARREEIRIANVMRALKWKASVRWIDGRSVRGYAPLGTPAAGKKEDVDMEGLI